MEAAFYTVAEVAEQLRITRQTVYALIASGDLEALRLGSGPKPRFRISERALAEFIGEDLAVVASEFKTHGTDVDLDSAAVHAIAMHALEERGITEPTADEYAQAVEIVQAGIDAGQRVQAETELGRIATPGELKTLLARHLRDILLDRFDTEDARLIPFEAEPACAPIARTASNRLPTACTPSREQGFSVSRRTSAQKARQNA